jgi:hypothetical protein
VTLRALVLVVFGTALTQAPLAQAPATQTPRYTVQTVAMQDYRQALDTAQSLRDLAFDAYVDFAMFDGRQFARVRVGCFESREAAETLAQYLAGNVTREAVPAELSEAATPALCWQREVGFTLPPTWSEFASTPEAVAYAVEVMGHRGVMVFAGERWRLAQSEEEALDWLERARAQPVSHTAPLFEQQTRNGRPLVVVSWRARPVVVTNGMLLWQRGPFAVVLEGDAVVAYHATAYRRP